MLNREEYNMTFGCDLSEEEFERIMCKGITDDDILNGRVDKLTFCDKQGHKQEFAKVVKGEWVVCGGSFRCSECISMPEFKDIRRLHFCPNCGADMRGKDE